MNASIAKQILPLVLTLPALVNALACPPGCMVQVPIGAPGGGGNFWNENDAGANCYSYTGAGYDGAWAIHTYFSYFKVESCCIITYENWQSGGMSDSVQVWWGELDSDGSQFNEAACEVDGANTAIAMVAQ